jgi:hypothetical protein
VGWKAACIFVNEDDPGYFGTSPPHREERAVGLLFDLYGDGRIRPAGDSTLQQELVPPKGHFGFGAYDAGCVLSDWDEVPGCAADGNKPILRRCLSLFPEASVLVFELASAVNAFGYALYERGSLRRAYAGDAQNGITTDIGQLLPEEEPFFRDSEVRQGQRFFRTWIDGELTEFDAAAFGEELAFHVLIPFVGVPFDRFRSESLPMGRFRRRSRLANIF